MTDEQRIREIRSRLLMAKALCAQANISLSTTGADTEFLLEKLQERDDALTVLRAELSVLQMVGMRNGWIPKQRWDGGSTC